MRTLKTALLLTAAAIAALTGCQKEPAGENNGDLVLNETSITLAVNETFQLEVTSPETDPSEIVWSSDKESVATVSDNGLVTAVGEGSASITVSVGSLVSNCSVTVTAGQAEPVDFYEIDMTAKSADEVKTEIQTALSAGEVNFKLIGPFEKTGIPVDGSSVNIVYDQNPFYCSNVEVIDLSEVTDWPEVDVDGQLDYETWQPDLDGVYGLPAFAFVGRVTNQETEEQTETYPNLREVILADEAQAIGVQAFWYNGKLENVKADGATHIGLSAFSYCESLTDLSYPKVTTLYNYSFAYSSLTSITLPSATFFGYGSFEQCPSLTSLVLTAAGDFSFDTPPYGTLNTFAFNFNTSACDLQLNIDKHFSYGTAYPKANSEKQWSTTSDGTALTWKSIEFVE
ncbi:MAG TPA: leucine-rich repeat protein [Candidatus Coprenecus pullistercoris]|nr:leucine-rich repeat protein [Candidatus Coprenecus pullistercoris]